MDLFKGSDNNKNFEITINDFNLDEGDILDLRSVPSISRNDIDTSFIDDILWNLLEEFEEL